MKRIENQIKNNEIKTGTEEEKRILRYIANIICIDTLEPKSGYKSPIIEELIKRNKIQILELAKSKNSNIEVPFSLLDSNESIDISIQNTVYKQLFELHVDKNRSHYLAMWIMRIVKEFLKSFIIYIIGRKQTLRN